MKWMQGEIENTLFVGLVLENGKILDVGRGTYALLPESHLPMTMLQCLEEHENAIEVAEKLLSYDEQTLRFYTYAPEDVKWHAPIISPYKHVLCIGKNYAEHAKEMAVGATPPDAPVVFTKAPDAVIGPHDAIPSHKGTTSELDYEGELALVIGKGGRNIAKKDAFDHIFGYTIVNDVTARDLQKKHMQFYLGKSLDGTCPMGPYIVSKGAVTDIEKVTIKTTVNNEVRQQGVLSDLLFDIPTLIETLSEGRTLRPGDVIATGTPAGVGKAMKPPVFLKNGDVVTITVEGIGQLSNVVRDEV
ncbi:fumarylacetoacetate hydrolase family protein [Aureibacillus halotolerans]|uniref:2-keto-4-pentenoate hydratase/2-oxohepta-3-ene-1,7-dioic acid hydratase in catechol pathway n=1 Tax=Aureibacillus halotolerans TaxID=1508390 RepID=A0A4R6U6D8_9BACI|nr:fumarylacetoacetate hydrolase family protein [Aureibacillus halotolerans]TDQ42080.1 2-keto-4-pentenoate hydratase/2-oxohepta-3-ene-1,7-dioic acid hydratase in catechol pathway [Aureibacillus halotolerans]